MQGQLLSSHLLLLKRRLLGAAEFYVYWIDVNVIFHKLIASSTLGIYIS
jgi:hypothetical protein